MYSERNDSSDSKSFGALGMEPVHLRYAVLVTASAFASRGLGVLVVLLASRGKQPP